MTFEDLGLGPEILKAVRECGYDSPTPIQEKAIPPILMTRDVVGLAQTGTGKTASFILPMIEILAGGRARARMPRSLVLTPTRELAAQVAGNFDTYGVYHKLSMALLVGGESLNDQVKKLDKGVDVLIATPGRLLDLFDRGAILLSDIKILVIDEADRMMDMGFIPDIEKIVSLVPPIRQTLLFSATMPPEIKRLADKFLSNPKQVSVAPAATTADTVEQGLLWVSSPKGKSSALASLVKQQNVQNAFVFCNRKRDIGAVAKALEGKGYSVAPMHGDMQQSVRTQTLKDFKDGKITLLVCSDVAARGLDVSGVSHVFNYDVPMNADDYVHRIGRTGRAGATGHAFTIAVESDRKFVDAIEKLIKNPIPVISMEGSSAGDEGQKERAGSTDKGAPQKKGQGRSAEARNKRGKTGSSSSRRSGRGKEGRASAEEKHKGFGDDVPDFFR